MVPQMLRIRQLHVRDEMVSVVLGEDADRVYSGVFDRPIRT